MGCMQRVNERFKNVRLLVDIDYKPKDVDKFASDIANKMNFIDFTFGTVFTKVKCFETTKGLHLMFDLITDEQWNDIDTIICQMALGSDYKRELFNYRRIRGKKKVKEWNVLFRKKVKRDKDGNVVYVSEEKITDLSKEIESKIMEYYLRNTLGDIPEIRKQIKEEERKEMLKDIVKLIKKHGMDSVYRYLL